ncbi:MAG: FtsX-like permease family protein [Cellvibrionaceae bacterium]|nr:FtsX-like permease family protein [Cellvibrionaceae bacterium]
MRMLQVKLLRNLWQLKGQAAAIATVVAGGVAMFIMSFTVLQALRATQEAFYAQYHFADVFADVRRAPVSLERIADIPGIQQVEGRIVAPVNVRLEGFNEPITGRAVSLPDGGTGELNQIYLSAGQLPQAFSSDQVVISEAFAEAHKLRPGDKISAVIRGRMQALTIVGLALSPEYIYQIQPGAMVPDYQRYCILWLNHSALEAAFDMEGAFNTLSAQVAADTQVADIIERLDLQLKNWGALGAYDRSQQTSHMFLKQELDQLQVMATVMPAIFLGVAAFLLNVVAARLIRTQRDQIAILKAFGYSNIAIGRHYLTLVLLIALIGVVLGVAAGRELAVGLGGLYQEYYRFPWLLLELRLPTVASATAVTLAAALLGTLKAVYSAVSIAPAEAMRPEPPAIFGRTLLERAGFHKMHAPARMVLRNLERQPAKTLLSITGIAMSVAILIVSGFQKDAINYMIRVQFSLAEKQSATVQFFETESARAQFELASLPGVDYVEPLRNAPVVLRNGQWEYRTAIRALPENSQLNRILDKKLRQIPLRDGGLFLSDYLAKHLRLQVGDKVRVEFLDGARRQLDLPIAATIEDYVGLNAYMTIDSLSLYRPEKQAMEGALLTIVADQEKQVKDALLKIPQIAGVNFRSDIMESFRRTMDETLLTFTFFSVLLAGSIAFAVVYNNARIAFAERARELASLRVLGFSQAEVARILIGEILMLTLAAIPFGFILGYGFAAMIALGLQTEIYRVPLILSPSTFATAALVVVVATVLSTFIVIKKLRGLDMLRALKSAE